MVETIALILGMTTIPGLNNIGGTCHGLESVPIPCLMQEQPYGIRYVTDGKSVYQFRPVWFGGRYSVTRDGKPLPPDICRPMDTDHICIKTFTFISDK